MFSSYIIQYTWLSHVTDSAKISFLIAYASVLRKYGLKGKLIFLFDLLETF